LKQGRPQEVPRSVAGIYGHQLLQQYVGCEPADPPQVHDTAEEQQRHQEPAASNAIVPGWYFTEMTEELRGTAFEQSVIRRTPAGRWGDALDLVGTCVYLSSAASDYVNGAVITVDGGYAVSDGLDRT
jgi:hypothetical protein